MRPAGTRATSGAIAALLLPTIAAAQATGAFGSITARALNSPSGYIDHSGNGLVATLAKGNMKIQFPPPAAPTNPNYLWINAAPGGAPDAHNGVDLYVVGVDGQYASTEILDYSGTSANTGTYPSLDLETYGCSRTRGACAVPAGQITGAVFSAALNGAGDPADAALVFLATENQTPTHNGMGLQWWYTPNGSKNYAVGAGVSQGGNGGFTVGGAAVADLGPGTLDAASTIASSTHFTTRGPHGVVRSCGTSPVFEGGTDQAGRITVGAGATSCTYDFSTAWGGPPICLVQTYKAPAPTTYVSDQQAGHFTVTFSAPFSGSFQYICMGVG